MRTSQWILLASLIVATVPVAVHAQTQTKTIASSRTLLASTRPASLPFTVEIEGIEAGQFQGVDGLSAELEVIEYQDGNDLFLRKQPGRARFSNITLKRGVINSADLRNWWADVRAGSVQRRTISIVLLDPRSGAEIQRWNLFGCWPKQWKIGGFDGKGNDVVTEEITFVVEQVEIQ